MGPTGQNKQLRAPNESFTFELDVSGCLFGCFEDWYDHFFPVIRLYCTSRADWTV